jgi:hypothetical protein
MPAAGLAKKSLDLAPIDARPFDDDAVAGSPPEDSIGHHFSPFREAPANG